jgi:hypothetical protein
VRAWGILVQGPVPPRFTLKLSAASHTKFQTRPVHSPKWQSGKEEGFVPNVMHLDPLGPHVPGKPLGMVARGPVPLPLPSELSTASHRKFQTRPVQSLKWQSSNEEGFIPNVMHLGPSGPPVPS